MKAQDTLANISKDREEMRRDENSYGKKDTASFRDTAVHIHL